MKFEVPKIQLKVTAKTGNLALSIVAMLGGCVILILTKFQSLSLFSKGLPGARFFPVLCGAAITLCGIGILINTLRRIRVQDPELEKNLIDENELTNFLFVTGLSVFTLIAYRWIGLLVCLFVVVLVVCRFLSKETWKKSLLVAAGTLIAFYLCFVVGLNIPMPNSLIGI